MYFVEYDKLDVPNEVRAFVKHTSQDLRGHDEAVSFRIDLNIAGQDTNRGGTECLFEVSVFLV